MEELKKAWIAISDINVMNVNDGDVVDTRAHVPWMEHNLNIIKSYESAIFGRLDDIKAYESAIFRTPTMQVSISEAQEVVRCVETVEELKKAVRAINVLDTQPHIDLQWMELNMNIMQSYPRAIFGRLDDIKAYESAILRTPTIQVSISDAQEVVEKSMIDNTKNYPKEVTTTPLIRSSRM